jgi:D-3-phosphoglycerate dehydrogenase / 2-oxoglutarate reductase
MVAPKVLITDYAWPSLDIERTILGAAGAELLIAPPGDDGELLELARQASAILTCWRPVTAQLLDVAVDCRTVARYGVGLDNIDVVRATELGMLVTNVPHYCVDEVSDHAAALILALSRHVTAFARDVVGGRWDNTAHGPMHRLRGRTLGLVGYGAIAQALAVKMHGFGMDVIAYSPRLRDRRPEHGVVAVPTLDDLLRSADVVSLHVPLNDTTAGMIDEHALSLMKPTAFLINTARGQVVDSVALFGALTSGRLAGAGIDVLSQEPPGADNPLLADLPNLIVTPHAAFASVESLVELQTLAATHVLQVLLGGLPDNIVNPQVMDTPAFATRHPTRVTP